MNNSKKTIFLFLWVTEEKNYHDFHARTIVFRDFERSASYCWWPFTYRKNPRKLRRAYGNVGSARESLPATQLLSSPLSAPSSYIAFSFPDFLRYSHQCYASGRLVDRATLQFKPNHYWATVIRAWIAWCRWFLIVKKMSLLI